MPGTALGTTRRLSLNPGSHPTEHARMHTRVCGPASSCLELFLCRLMSGSQSTQIHRFTSTLGGLSRHARGCRCVHRSVHGNRRLPAPVLHARVLVIHALHAALSLVANGVPAPWSMQTNQALLSDNNGTGLTASCLCQEGVGTPGHRAISISKGRLC